MNAREIREAIERLRETAWRLEQAYTEGGGEITDETEGLEAERAAVAALLTTEGVDDLGRWLKSKEDELATFKAERTAADARIKSCKRTIDYIKDVVGEILRETGTDKVKGSFYSFAQFDSQKTSVDTDALDAEYLEQVTEAARNAGLPDYCDVAIVTNVKRIQEWGKAQGDVCGFPYLYTEVTPTSKYIKPRGADKEA